MSTNNSNKHGLDFATKTALECAAYMVGFIASLLLIALPYMAYSEEQHCSDIFGKTVYRYSFSNGCHVKDDAFK